jgi:hypothetical protein
MIDRVARWNMGIVWLLYFLILELLSLAPSASDAPLCILLSNEPNGEHHACATMHEAIFRFATFVWENASHDNIIAAGTIAIAAFTYVLFRSTDKLWIAGESQRKLAEDTAQRQIRAYVHVKAFRYETRYLPNLRTQIGTVQPEVIVTWENTGASPTVNARSNINWMTFTQTEPMPSDYDFPDDKDRKPFTAVIGPKQTQELILTAIPPRTLQLVATRKLKLYVWGWIDYNDVFEDTPRRRTEFCSVVQLHGDPETTNCIMTLRTYPRHNGADQSCEKKPKTEY